MAPNAALRDLKSLEVTVRISKIFWLRMWALKTLLLLAARVSCASVRIEEAADQ